MTGSGMTVRGSDYLYLLAVIAFTVYGQIITKWRVSQMGAMPTEITGRLRFVTGALFDPFILSGLAAALLASLAWIAAMTRFELTYAYPFMALNFVIVVALGGWLFGEPVGIARAGGVALIVLGTLLVARS